MRFVFFLSIVWHLSMLRGWMCFIVVHILYSKICIIHLEKKLTSWVCKSNLERSPFWKVAHSWAPSASLFCILYYVTYIVNSHVCLWVLFLIYTNKDPLLFFSRFCGILDALFSSHWSKVFKRQALDGHSKNGFIIPKPFSLSQLNF